MGQDISLKVKGKTHDSNHDLKFSANTINFVCHSIRSMFRLLGIYITLQVVQKCTQCLVKKQFVIGNEALKVFNKVETNLLHHSRKGYRIK